MQKDTTHQWRVLERVPYRLQQSLSDIGGYDHSIHAGTIEGTLEVLLDIFGSSNRLLLNEVEDPLWVYRRVREFRATTRGSIYRPNAFRNLIVAARTFAIERANQPDA